jgi:hypothetical protein
MKVLGQRELPILSPFPSSEALKRAAAVNDVLSSLLPGGRTAIVKGLYRYRTLADANRHQDTMLAAAMAAGRPAHA